MILGTFVAFLGLLVAISHIFDDLFRYINIIGDYFGVVAVWSIPRNLGLKITGTDDVHFFDIVRHIFKRLKRLIFQSFLILIFFLGINLQLDHLFSFLLNQDLLLLFG